MSLTIEKPMEYDKDRRPDLVCWRCEEAVKVGSRLEPVFRKDHADCDRLHEQETEWRYSQP